MAYTQEQLIVSRTIESLRSGDHISDEDIEVTIKVLEPLVDMVGCMGDAYHLFWKELFFRLQTLKDYKRSRASHAPIKE